MYVAGRIGWPRGFYFQATFWMTVKKHGAICATQHAGGSLLVFLSLFFFFQLLVSSVGLSSWGAEGGGTKGFRRIVVTGLSLCFLSVCPLLVWLPAPAECSCVSLFFEVEECRLRSHWVKQLLRGVQEAQPVWEEWGGGWGKWFWLGSDLRSSVRDWRWVYKHMGGGPIGILGFS